ncbi:hypothetical protein ACOM2C_01175 [Pseudarthrobacter sp. So.54]
MTENDANPVPGSGENAAEAERKARGTGSDGTIPVSDEGISLTTTDDGSNFDPEEDAPDGPGQATAEK